jgi:CRP-like cAMP-binding protein
VVKAADVFTPEILGVIQRLSEDVARLKGVTRVDSLATVDVVVIDLEPDGSERTLAIVGPGGIFGEMGVVDDSHHTVSARAEAASEVLRLDFDAFERLRKRFPYTAAKVFRNLARILSECLQDTTTALLYLSSGGPALAVCSQPGTNRTALPRPASRHRIVMLSEVGDQDASWRLTTSLQRARADADENP